MNRNDLALPYRTEGLPLGARLFVGMLQKLSTGSLTLVDPQGQVAHFGMLGACPHAELQVHDWRAATAILRQGDIGFAESYKQGWVDSSDMLALFTLALRNEAAMSQAVNGRWWALLLKRLAHLVLRDNNRRGSRRNISAHYDLGNPFYQLWLDPSMSYSAALFQPGAEQTLEAAQWAKYDRILDQLNAAPGQTVLEIGCGWGGFAERAAQRGLKVHGVTLSTEQLAWAQARMARLGLSEQVSLTLTDYRDIEGQFDHIVSIEMVEAVGERWWPTYFGKLASLRKPGGRVVIQSIDIVDERFESYRSGTDFIQQYIFPGGMLPSPQRFEAQARAAGLLVLDQLEFGLDYAATLRLWRMRFEEALETVRAQGYDEAFIRLWRMYFIYCEAGFREGRTGVRQWTLG
ncbi:cyclopropane-fatty-acyl-phospholipid synthase family protein [Chitinimonas viridis]|uniref:Cyclopropane-fatty-acyl-phospholipid synthase family protein n=1 Tax=Chitinimonas viridis TaxID=664880 RepID=A0ABT8B4X7_9NEIS|nr:cyclopropane-fatty-acyl-phospholipid synthase family protein [Chitinimonas viridis]MDN3577313.1 cyclopropane-fatty-acyl-phospholipid synthase family protein [Chitinimonas viridis]